MYLTTMMGVALNVPVAEWPGLVFNKLLWSTVHERDRTGTGTVWSAYGTYTVRTLNYYISYIAVIP